MVVFLEASGVPVRADDEQSTAHQLLALGIPGATGKARRPSAGRPAPR